MAKKSTDYPGGGDPGIDVERPTLGKSIVHFTGHALAQMKLRGVKQWEVFEVLDDPHTKNLPTQKGRKRWRRERNDRTSVDVVFETKKDRVRVVTAMKIKRPKSTRKR